MSVAVRVGRTASWGEGAGVLATESFPRVRAALLATGLALLACDSGAERSAPTGGSGRAGSAGGLGATGASGGGGALAGGGGTSWGGTFGGGGRAGLGGMAPSAGVAGNGVAGAIGGTAGAAGATEPAAIGYDVLVNPYGFSPLVAVVNLHGVAASSVVSVEVVVAGQGGAPDFTKVYSPADAEFVNQLDTSDLVFPEPGYHVPVLGLYADTDNDVRVHVERSDQQPVDVTLRLAAPLSSPDEPAWVPSIRIDAASEPMEPGWTVAELNIEPLPSPPIVFVEWTRSIAFDERGAIRWALRLDDLPQGETFTLRRSMTGNFLTGSLDTVVEVTKLGRILRSFRLPEHTIHHEILQIGSGDSGEGASDGTPSEYAGDLLVLASKNGASTVQDRVLELNAVSGAVLHEWDLAQVLDPTRTTFVDPEEWAPGVGDWLHENGLAYSAADESLIVSGRHQGVAKLRRDGSLVWLLAPHEGWNEPQLGKLLTAVDAAGVPYDEAVQLGDEAAGDPAAPEFDWPFGQHSPALLPNGDLLLFDNGCSRHWGPLYASYSRAVIYRIDEAAMTIRQIGQFALTSQESSYYVSNTYQLPQTGHILVQPGGSANRPAVVKEVTTSVASDGTIDFGSVVFDAAVDLGFADPSSTYVYSYRAHRWSF